MDRLDPRTSLLLVVDVQERLAAAMPPPILERLVANALVLLETARLLAVPVVASEQYPNGLGPTLAPIAEKLRALGVVPIDKLTFDACGEPRVAGAIADRAPRAVVIVGVETHVCVFQTARELARRQIDVRVVADAVASRREESRALGLSMCERAGALVMPAEAVVFDWLERAGTDEFRAISRLVR
ncbi:MAG TPA: isochorismatase family protein [Polyangiaceae bacterium]|nr:isochorismatase family protein [Polyangiaceae bacterium]